MHNVVDVFEWKFIDPVWIIAAEDLYKFGLPAVPPFQVIESLVPDPCIDVALMIQSQCANLTQVRVIGLSIDDLSPVFAKHNPLDILTGNPEFIPLGLHIIHHGE
jgi:hypothetical protein